MFHEMTMQIRVPSIDEGVKWYEKVIGKPADFIPHEGFAEWELIPNRWLQVAEGGPAVGSGPIRVGISDMEKELKRLEFELGVQEVEVFSRAEVPVKWSTFRDPWGNQFGYFQYKTDIKGMKK